MDIEHMEHKEHSMINDIADELEGACHYAKLAHHYKGKDEMLARKYMEMAPQELHHARELFEIKVREIEEILK